jgi:hypothetical protein
MRIKQRFAKFWIWLTRYLMVICCNGRRRLQSPLRVLSTEYSAEILPDPGLRRIVTVAGVLLALAGNILIVSLPLAISVRVFGMVLWTVSTLRELVFLRRAWAGCIALKFVANGEVELLGPDREWRPAQLCTGSILLRSIGWLRVKTAAGQVFAELVRADRQQSRDWRHLQVIWRHVGA